MYFVLSMSFDNVRFSYGVKCVLFYVLMSFVFCFTHNVCAYHYNVVKFRRVPWKTSC